SLGSAGLSMKSSAAFACRFTTVFSRARTPVIADGLVLDTSPVAAASPQPAGLVNCQPPAAFVSASSLPLEVSLIAVTSSPPVHGRVRTEFRVRSRPHLQERFDEPVDAAGLGPRGHGLHDLPVVLVLAFENKARAALLEFDGIDFLGLGAGKVGEQQFLGRRR